MRPLREKRQQYGGDPTIEIQRPEPVRVRPTAPGPNISGKRTTLSQLIDRALDRWEAQGRIPHRRHGYRLPDTPQRETKRLTQKRRRKEYLEGVDRVEMPNE